MNRLTDAKVRKAPAGRHGDGAGLWLDVRESVDGMTRRQWLLRYVSPTTAKSRELGLGAYPAVGLADARLARDDARRLVASGIDPVDQRAKERQAQRDGASAVKPKTFDELTALLIESKSGGWRNPKSMEQWKNSMKRYVSPTIGHKAAATIAFEDVQAILSPLWTTKPETASRVRGRIEKVLDYAAVVEGAQERTNPARWKGRLDNVFAPRAKVRKIVHFPALPYKDVPAFVFKLRGMLGIASRALEFAVLTAARSAEVRGVLWGEVDLDDARWVVPADKMKAEKEHHVALSKEAVQLLRALREGREVKADELVFPSSMKPGRPLSDMTLTAVLRRMKVTFKNQKGEEIEPTVHGFRSSFRDWAGETTAFARETVEHAMSHQIPDKAEAAYARGDHFLKRRKLMQHWANYLGKSGATVTRIDDAQKPRRAAPAPAP